jgi:opacity protein-like surface antigen
MNALHRIALAAALLAASAGAAMAQRPAPPTPPNTQYTGIYLVAAGGRTQYDYDCWYWADCDTARSTFGKAGGGYRFGWMGVEGWFMDFGRADIRPTPDTLRLRAGVVNAVWYLQFGPHVEGLLRAGLADVRHERSLDGRKSNYAGYFGIGAVFNVAPMVAFELSWDVTAGEGRDAGTATGAALNAGLRLKF